MLTKVVNGQRLLIIIDKINNFINLLISDHRKHWTENFLLHHGGVLPRILNDDQIQLEILMSISISKDDLAAMILKHCT